MSEAIGDVRQRREALDAKRSFIVQAPAGSGKTELLIQRYLMLLAGVDEPEEIAAITFTRKASAEMRKRVLEALQRARNDDAPIEPHQALTWELARAARARDLERGWQIEDNAARLRIQTIDALCASLTRQMPMLSRFGAQPESIDDAGALYLEAARNTLALLESGGAAAADAARLLAHLDNDPGVAETLIANMLRYRDQWLRNLHKAHEREALEAALKRARGDALLRLSSLFPRDAAAEVVWAAAHAAGNVAQVLPESPLCFCEGLDALPGSAHGDFANWLGIAELLLTGEGTWRKQVNKNTGFPAGESSAEKAHNKAMKARMTALLGQLAQHEALRPALHELRLLPPARYSDDQWDALGAIVRLLPLATAELWSVFAAHGQCDFTEIAQAASRALGAADAPTDLALSLDYRIRHLLVDEFQDTSFAQFELLEKLTAGWQQGDARTLFLVGDPMQSIYRFREAEVGLFLKARREGIGSVHLDPLTLSANFRSQSGIVDWVNATFSRIMAAEEDMASGAVRYAHSSARHGPEPGDAVSVHALIEGAGADEAERVLDIVQRLRADDANQTVALLVRNRNHLDAIVPALKAAGLAFRAVDIEPLGERQPVQDLLSLTRALVHLADRTAWLAVLRAPWCGLSLADLTQLAQDQGRSTIWESMRDEARVANLSADGRDRMLRVREVFESAIADRRRGTLRNAVEGAWLALGGPACMETVADLEDSERYFDYLQEREAAGTLPGMAEFEQGVARLYAAPDPQAGERLQIMTLHKAKGLEFDAVIVPGLGRAQRHDEPKLMLWMERPRPDDGDGELLLAPIRAAGSDSDAIYDYIARLERERQSHEDVRLLYVAATRARSRLHLLAGAPLKQKGDVIELVEPKTGTLLAPLWPAVRDIFMAAMQGQRAPQKIPAATPVRAPASISRLASGWSLPPPPEAVRIAALQEPAVALQLEVEFSWASETARHVGTVVHRFLQAIAEDGVARWDAKRPGLNAACERDLVQLGVARADAPQAAARVQAALAATLADARGRWLLDAQREARSELRLTGVIDGAIVNSAIDRTFVDAEGTRWIIDFKTGVHEGGEVERFLDSEQLRYRPQLERYATLMESLNPGPVKLGLYFPLLGGWREWPYQ